MPFKHKLGCVFALGALGALGCARNASSPPARPTGIEADPPMTPAAREVDPGERQPEPNPNPTVPDQPTSTPDEPTPPKTDIREKTPSELSPDVPSGDNIK